MKIVFFVKFDKRFLAVQKRVFMKLIHHLIALFMRINNIGLVFYS